MPFVKLDTGMLESTIWLDRLAREVFITALLMAEPHETKTGMAQFEVGEIKETGFIAPPGWYGFVRASGPGIVRRAGVPGEEGMEALKRLGSPDAESRSPEFQGRRMIRVDGGYLILNFMKYRERDYTGAERARKYRQLKKLRDVTRDGRDVTRDDRDASQESMTRHANVTPTEYRVQNTEVRKTVGTTSSDVESKTTGNRNIKSASAFILPDWIPHEIWNGFVEMRRKKRLPLTENAKRIIVRKLTEIGGDPVQVLEQSTANSWTSVWPLQEFKSNGKPRPEPRRAKSTVEEIIRDSRRQPGPG